MWACVPARGLGVRHSGVPLLSPHFAGDLMKFGLIYELSTPRPFTRETQQAVYENAIEHTVLADALAIPPCGASSTIFSRNTATQVARRCFSQPSRARLDTSV